MKSFLDIFSEGGETLIIGLSITFLVLFILIISIRIMSAALRGKKDNDENHPQEIAVVPNNLYNPAPQAEDEGEVVAAIIAALAVISQQTGGQFRLKSFRRVGESVWARAGRQDIINSRY